MIYIYVQPQIVGSEGNYGRAFYSDLEEKKTLKEALDHGFKTLQHDDFWVCAMKNNKVVKIYHSDETPRPNSDVDIKEVNWEFGW